MKFVLASDDNYWLQTYVAIHSLVSNNRQDELEIYILCDNTNAKFERGIKKLKELNPSLEIKFIIVKDSLEKLKGFKIREHLTRGTYYRFFLQEFLSPDLDRIVYLDGDIIVNGSLADLYNVNFEGNLLAAVPQIEGTGPDRLGFPAGSKYFNAGVLVINLDKWRNDNISEKLIKFSTENHNIIQWPSQDPLNAVAFCQWVELPRKFNLYHGFIEDKSYVKESKPAIIHYSGSTKPWYDRDNHPYKKLYWKYLRQTPYRFYLPKDLASNKLKKVLPKSVLKRLKGKEQKFTTIN